jgi:hypothetical protein
MGGNEMNGHYVLRFVCLDVGQRRRVAADSFYRAGWAGERADERADERAGGLGKMEERDLIFTNSWRKY